ncbi:MAG: hypothetical protein HN725_19685 [Alphaproteobacteria bacterium]|jgi:hypothetical protein|nr:hypothetical protein [Alphaproteobacteria bacterium]MBT4083540.1 hypothetical protein [Alphaproteobacteria bacterium]MBT4546687.1 hypothetical protein [Alphaproteobacteria bacterium]MBT7747518.1 hypothetical protein [Alphaproteobacteria bacterium]
MTELTATSSIDRVFDYLPTDVRQELSESQIGALADAIKRSGWRQNHKVNIRLSIPLIFTRIFVTVIAGAEKREPDRRQIEKSSHPLRTFGNFLFVGAVALLIYAIALAGILAYSSILEF